MRGGIQHGGCRIPRFPLHRQRCAPISCPVFCFTRGGIPPHLARPDVSLCNQIDFWIWDPRPSPGKLDSTVRADSRFSLSLARSRHSASAPLF